MVNKIGKLQPSTSANSLQKIQKCGTPINSIWGTSINGEIEDTKQGDTGDCWLLTHMNALRDTKWGKKLIKNAIKSDGAGGAIINFKGAKGSQKEFHISVDELIKARESGIYSSGDDDMIAMELAVEKYLSKDGVITNPGELIDGGKFNSAEFVELLSGKPATYNIALSPQNNLINETERSYNEKLRMLTEIEKHPKQYLVEASFQGTVLDGVTFGKHAYQVKKVVTENGKKFVILVNPWNSSENIKMDIDKFIIYSRSLEITENPDEKPNPNLRSDLTKKYDYNKLITNLVKNFDKKDDETKLKDFKAIIQETNADNIKEFFTDKSLIDAFISVLDNLKSGWGNGKEKKELIAPLVDAYCEYAKKQGVAEDIINDVKQACYKELDATFYTDEDVIIEKLQLLFDEIKKKNPILQMLEMFNNFPK